MKTKVRKYTRRKYTRENAKKRGGAKKGKRVQHQRSPRTLTSSSTCSTPPAIVTAARNPFSQELIPSGDIQTTLTPSTDLSFTFLLPAPDTPLIFKWLFPKVTPDLVKQAGRWKRSADLMNKALKKYLPGKTLVHLLGLWDTEQEAWVLKIINKDGIYYLEFENSEDVPILRTEDTFSLGGGIFIEMNEEGDKLISSRGIFPLKRDPWTGEARPHSESASLPSPPVMAPSSPAGGACQIPTKCQVDTEQSMFFDQRMFDPWDIDARYQGGASLKRKSKRSKRKYKKKSRKR